MKRILAIVDPQKDFIDGSLGVGLDKWEKAYQEILRLVRETHKKGEYSAFVVTRDWHPGNHCSFTDEGGQWPSHCVENTSGALIYQGLLDTLLSTGKPVYLLNKGKDPKKEEYGMDVLQSDTDKEQLSNADIVDIVGLCYDYCVAECAKLTAEWHPNTQVNIIKTGTVAITDNEPLKEVKLKNLSVIK